MMWKILTSQIREEICYSLVSRGLFPEKQKGCHKRTRRTGDLQYIEQHIFKESKMRQKMWPWSRLTTERPTTWSHKAGK